MWKVWYLLNFSRRDSFKRAVTCETEVYDMIILELGFEI
jgi:hypothetical protein